MNNSLHQSIEALRAFYENLYKGHNAVDYNVSKAMDAAGLVADLAVAKMSEKLSNEARVTSRVIHRVDACEATLANIQSENEKLLEKIESAAVEQAAREAVQRAAPRYVVGEKPVSVAIKPDFKAELSKSLDELRDAAFELIVGLKDRQDAKRGAM